MGSKQNTNFTFHLALRTEKINPTLEGCSGGHEVFRNRFNEESEDRMFTAYGEAVRGYRGKFLGVEEEWSTESGQGSTWHYGDGGGIDVGKDE